MGRGDPFKSVVPDDAVPSSEADLSKVDTPVAHPARIYDYLWRPNPEDAAPAEFKSGHCGVARKP